MPQNTLSKSQPAKETDELPANLGAHAMLMGIIFKATIGNGAVGAAWAVKAKRFAKLCQDKELLNANTCSAVIIKLSTTLPVDFPSPRPSGPPTSTVICIYQ